MAFIRIRDKKNNEAIINTDMISCITKTRNGYLVFFSSGNPNAAYYEYDHIEIAKIFNAIGVALY